MESIHFFGGIFAVAFLVFLIINLLGFDEMDAGSGDMDFAADGASFQTEVFNFRSFLILFIGFGAAGGFARYYGASNEISALAGVLFGGVLVTLAVFIYRGLKGQQGNTRVSLASAVGNEARVVVRIDEHAIGEVRVNVNGVMTSATARAKSGSVAEGETVRVVEVDGSELVVEKVVQ